MLKLQNIFFLIVPFISFLTYSMEKPKNVNKLIGTYWYCDHALLRMSERNISADKIEWTINHGDRYNTLVKDRQLCVSLPKHLGVVFDSKRGTVVTVLKSMNEEKLKRWLEKRSSATEEDRKKAEAKYERYAGLNEGQKPVSKKDLRIGTLRID